MLGAVKTRLTVLRRTIQIGMLAVLGQWAYYGILRCPFPVPFVSCLDCPVITCHGRIATMFWGYWLAMPLGVFLFGRMFCGWMCPGGFVNQMIGKLAIVKGRVKTTLTSILSNGVYPALALCLFLWLYMNNPRWIVPIRVGEFWNSLLLSFEHADTAWLVRTFFVLAAVAAGFIFANAWCRFICPMGGALETLKRFSLFRVYKTDACNHCNQCLSVCEMGTLPDERNCTNCADCAGSCPVGAIKIGRKGGKTDGVGS